MKKYIILSLLLVLCGCSKQLCVNPNKTNEASKLYFEIYSNSVTSGHYGWAENDAGKAVLSVYGIPCSCITNRY